MVSIEPTHSDELEGRIPEPGRGPTTGRVVSIEPTHSDELEAHEDIGRIDYESFQ